MTTDDPKDPSTVFFTLSLLIDSRQINGLARQVGGRKAEGFWNQALLKAIKPNEKLAESEDLQRDINPMFDDISDRSRNLFIQDFLLDTSGGLRDGPDHLRNVFEEVSLSLAGPVHWKAEGPVFEVKTAGPIGFERVLCRAFWMAHSNDALSYHLSFEVPFKHELKDYFGLSLFQKAFALSESTDWVIDDPALGWLVRGKGKHEKSLLDFIEGAFQRDVKYLMGKVIKASSVNLPEAFPERFANQAWPSLVLRSAGEAHQKPKAAARGQAKAPKTPAELWEKASSRRRLLVLLRDDESFEALQKARDCSSAIVNFKTLALKAGGQHDLAEIEAQLTRHAAELEEASATVIKENYQRWLFLSGFFQNVVDFLDQDGLEIHDGLDPVYPEKLNTGEVNPGFMLYATPSVFFEVVRKSRSLDKAGRRWLGTCPYLFLVHMTAFQNESLVHAYEDNVSSLVRYLEGKGLKSSAPDTSGTKFGSILAHASDCIHDFRLLTFEQVHKHYSFNVFRYQTERAFFESIEDVRGIKQRRAYWDEVLNHLTETIAGLQEDRRARYEKKIALAGVLLALSGVLQVWYVFFPLPNGGFSDELVQFVSPDSWKQALFPMTMVLLACGLGWTGMRVLGRWRTCHSTDPAKQWRRASISEDSDFF